MEGFIRVSESTLKTVADGVVMSAYGKLVRQKRTGQRTRPFAGAVESGDEDRQSVTRASAAVKLHPKIAATARKAELRPFSQTMDQEGEFGRFESQ